MPRERACQSCPKNHFTFLRLGKVRRRGSRELGDRHIGLAVAVGDCDRLLLLHLRRRAAEFDRSSTSPPGHRQGRHRACPPGQSPHLNEDTNSLTLCICKIRSQAKHLSAYFYEFHLLGLNLFLCGSTHICAVSADLWPRKGQRRAHMVPPADGLHLRERHPHCVAGLSRSHPLHVRPEAIYCQTPPQLPLKWPKCQIL